jgi:hypothetical protein
MPMKNCEGSLSTLHRLGGETYACAFAINRNYERAMLSSYLGPVSPCTVLGD